MKKKLIMIALIGTLVFCSCSAGSGTVESKTTQPSTETAAESSEDADYPPDEKAIRDRINDEYSGTVIDSITLNPDLGTDIETDYIALVNLTWNVQNSAKTSKKMLEMYSDDLAATVYSECPDVQELAIFWTVPYHSNANAKKSYERRSDGMYLTDTMFDQVFQ